jgi:hypothetical protein
MLQLCRSLDATRRSTQESSTNKTWGVAMALFPTFFLSGRPFNLWCKICLYCVVVLGVKAQWSSIYSNVLLYNCILKIDSCRNNIFEIDSCCNTIFEIDSCPNTIFEIDSFRYTIFEIDSFRYTICEIDSCRYTISLR